MKRLALLSITALTLTAGNALAWSNHSFAAYRAFENMPEIANAAQRFVALQSGEQVAPLAVVASATDESDYGLDINLWSDSPSEWGKTYGFGTQPFGNPALYFSTQAPFYMGFFHEDRVIYMAAPFIKKTFPLMRAHQFSSLAALAFRTCQPVTGKFVHQAHWHQPAGHGRTASLERRDDCAALEPPSGT